MALNPFASFSFLSGGGLSAALQPSNPRASSAMFQPSNPTGQSAMLDPSNPPALSGMQDHSNPPKVPGYSNTGAWPMPGQAPPPRSEIDPAWLYADTATVVSAALRKSAAKVVRTSDKGLSPKQLTAAALQRGMTAGTNLWRWAPEYRVKAVAADLLGRFQVHGQTLWLVDAKAVRGTSLSVQPERVFSIDGALAAVDMDEQLDKVIRAAIEREDRMPEILAQAAEIWPFYESLTGVNLSRAPSALELMAVAHDCAVHIVMLLKHNLAQPRPVQRSSLVMPVIATPGHGALPSGHATMAALTSELMHLLMVKDGQHAMRSAQLDRLARRIAFNRVVAGVHFPVDSQVGYALGTLLARLMAAMANAERTPKALQPGDILKARYELKELSTKDGSGRTAPGRGKYRVTASTLLKPLWQQARFELEQA